MTPRVKSPKQVIGNPIAAGAFGITSVYVSKEDSDFIRKHIRITSGIKRVSLCELHNGMFVGAYYRLASGRICCPACFTNNSLFQP